MRTPEQIRRQTTPAKHYMLTGAFVGTCLGFFLWFGGWALLHQKQARLYPLYCKVALQSSVSRWSYATFVHSRRSRATLPMLQYELMRRGNEDHRLDAAILHWRLYPRRAENPQRWVYLHGNVAPIYADPAIAVMKWPIALELITILACFLWGSIADYRYHVAILTGVHMDGSFVATINEYNREIRGDGMRYAVQEWTDR